ncbi:MAG: hypothetical protein ABIL58_13650 [Pseudomonadota bacterium]
MVRIVRPTIIDVEASGFGPGGYPIEIGLALSDGARFSCLILPLPEWEFWDPEAEKVHHLSRDILNRHGKPAAAVAAKLNMLLEERTVYSDGWVVDKPWVDLLYYAAGVRLRYTVSPLERILTEPQMALWHHTQQQVIGELNLQRHRASTDAMIIQETYQRTLAACSAE